MSDLTLQKSEISINGPLVLVILDGVGLYRGKKEGYDGNALDLADAPVLKNLLQNAPIHSSIRAHGTAVGMPSDSDMGNSEVGHNAMGAGRVFDQGAKLVSNAIQSGSIFQDETWMELIGNSDSPGHALKSGSAVHFIGLLSDGNVHSHIDHLLALLSKCKESGVQEVRVHVLLDGRDVNEVSALTYIDQLEDHLKQLSPEGAYRIASGGGRMHITMDRYEADWSMVERGWKTHVAGEGRKFSSAKEAIETYRKEKPGVIDQDLPAFVIEKDGKSAGPVNDDDVVIFYNFRGDRAIELSRAFTEPDFAEFKREPAVNVHYAGMMQYDGDLNIPPKYLVSPPSIDNTLSEYLVAAGIPSYAISETQKFGHVTYFWNGNNSQKFDESLETWKEVKSDVIPFDQKPEMKAVEITDALISAIQSGKYKFLRINYANGDMVGHTGSLTAAVKAMETVDQCLKRLVDTCNESGATLIVTADHGNCEEMFETNKDGSVKMKDGKPSAKTSHTLNPVPFLITGPSTEKFKLSKKATKPGLANIAATTLTLLGFKPPSQFEPSIVEAN